MIEFSSYLNVLYTQIKDSEDFGPERLDTQARFLQCFFGEYLADELRLDKNKVRFNKQTASRIFTGERPIKKLLQKAVTATENRDLVMVTVIRFLDEYLSPAKTELLETKICHLISDTLLIERLYEELELYTNVKDEARDSWRRDRAFLALVFIEAMKAEAEAPPQKIACDTFSTQVLDALRQKMNECVKSLEELQLKIEQCDDALMKSIYADQWEIEKSTFSRLKEEYQYYESQLHLTKLPDPSPADESDTQPALVDHQLYAEAEQWANDTISHIQFLDKYLENIITEYLFSFNFADKDTLRDILDNLPETKSVALALLEQTKNFDGVQELYDVLFYKYAHFLTREQLRELLELAQTVFAPFIWQNWAACCI